MSLRLSVPLGLLTAHALVAPEVILGGKAPYAGTKADIWSCGVMLYTLLFSSYPFERPQDRSDDATNAVLQRIVQLDYEIPDYPLVSADAKDLLRRLLVANADERLNIVDIVRHPWSVLAFGIVDPVNTNKALFLHCKFV